MQTYVNRNGDVYLSTMPRMMDDMPVAPKPFEKAIFNFEKGRWEMPFSVIFDLVKDIRKELLTLPVKANLPEGEYEFFYNELPIVESYLKTASGPIRWKTQSTTETGAPLFISLTREDLILVHGVILAFVQNCFDYENILTDAISEYLCQGCPKSGIEQIDTLLRNFPHENPCEDTKTRGEQAIDLLNMFYLQQSLNETTSEKNV